MASVATEQVLTIGGVKVHFPVKPYPSQLSMMDKIVKGLEKSQNCLLESPTGSGKSLALLCSALAWQKAFRDRVGREFEESKAAMCKTESEGMLGPETHGQSRYFGRAQHSFMNQTDGPNDQEEDSDDDFKPPKTQFRTSTGRQTNQASTPVPVNRRHVSVMYDEQPEPAWTMERLEPGEAADMDCAGCCEEEAEAKKPKIPKIWFGTRTHKQIAQITKELSRTAYNDVRMCILASREHTCIDPVISKKPNKTEECKNKCDGPGCNYKEKSRYVDHMMLKKSRKMASAWDLEDFVNFCRGKRACPYFGARELRKAADIIFCPYNYLVDPLIREAMEIKLNEQVVILDEAHNIEDSAREAASKSVELDKLEEAAIDLAHIINVGVKPQDHIPLKDLVDGFMTLIQDNGKHIQGSGSNFDQQNKTWSGHDMVALLHSVGAGPDNFKSLKKHLAAVSEVDDKAPEKEPMLKLRASTLQLLDGIFMVLDYIYRNQQKFRDDYRMVLVKSLSYFGAQTNDRWLKKNKNQHMVRGVTFSLHFWCMNPAVAFSDIGEAVRSIVLSSGTLSPMSSFQSELGVQFPIQLEASHVISSKQVWVGTISRGPRGSALLGNFQNTETFSYQDEVGNIVLEVCQTVPHGILLFLSSYKMLDKLMKRWQDIGLYQRISEFKEIMSEPRGSDSKADFDDLMNRFYAIIEETSYPDESEGGQTGALFIAVCRGKVSEGLDFTNNNARAVITVGIPFPNVKDRQVELKKQYNNEHSAGRGLLTGSKWYEIQAYRALNQALGRCIRHRYDWGALILVDERFAKNPQKYIEGLSKWVRKEVKYYNTFQQAQRSLKDFTKKRLEADPNMDNTLNTSCLDQSSLMVNESVLNAVRTPVTKHRIPAMFQTPANKPHKVTREERTPAARDTEDEKRGFVLPSQAGGFLPFEETQASGLPATATKRPDSPPMDPAMQLQHEGESQAVRSRTSTQATPTHSDGLSQFPDLSPIKSNMDKTVLSERMTNEEISMEKKPNIQCLKAKLDKFRLEYGRQTPPKKPDVKPPQTGGGEKKDMFQFVSVPPPTQVQGNVLEERCNSPSLFDEDLPGKFKEQVGADGDGEHMTPTKKPLFKTTVRDYFNQQPEKRGDNTRRSKLSRRSSDSKDSQDKSLGGQPPDQSRGSLRKTTTPSKRETETKSRTAKAMRSLQDIDPKQNKPEKDISKAIDDLLGISDQEEQSISHLKTKRSSVGKRRRTPSKPNTNKRQRQSSEEPEKALLVCRLCKHPLLKDSTAFEERPAPKFFANMGVSDSGDRDFNVAYVVTDSEQIVAHQLLVVQEQVKGVELNSYYSEENRCCVQFLRCALCQSSAPAVAARVKFAEESSPCSPGQVWFLKSSVVESTV